MAQAFSDCVIINGVILTGYFSLSPLFHFLRNIIDMISSYEQQLLPLMKKDIG